MTHCSPKKVHHCPPKEKKRSAWIEIGQKDLPFVATEGGNYRLKENVSFRSVFVAAITFNGAQSVLFDLNSFTIDLEQTGIQAIAVNNVDQLQIRNGRIINGNLESLQPIVVSLTPLTNFPDITDAAIRIRRSSNVVLQKLNIDHVLYGVVGTDLLDDIVVKNCQFFHFGVIATITTGDDTFTDPVGSGLVFSGRNTNQRLKDVTIENCQIQSETGYNGVLLNFVDGGNIINCQGTAGRLVRTGQSIGTYSFTDSSSIVIRDSSSRFSTQPIFALRSQGLKILNNQISNTNQDGIELVFCNNVVIEGNKISRTLDEPTLVSPGSGIKVQASNLITVRNNVVTGFTIGSSPTDVNGAGIAIGGSTGCIVESNDVSGNNFGIKQVLSVTLGPPPNNVFTGTPGFFAKNISFAALIQHYVGLNVDLVQSLSSLAAPWVNLFL